MTWGGYWLPHLIDWIVGGATATVVGILVRRMVRQAALQAGLHASEAATAATGATKAQGAAEAAERRLLHLEASVGGILDGVSASLGHRALDDLRFRTIEAQLEQRGRHAAAGDSEGR